MARREALPGADLLFRGDRPPPAAAPAKPKHDERVTVYWSAKQLAELDRHRLELRADGTRVDRGALIRAAVAMALDNPVAWTEQLLREET